MCHSKIFLFAISPNSCVSLRFACKYIRQLFVFFSVKYNSVQYINKILSVQYIDQILSLILMIMRSKKMTLKMNNFVL